MEQNNFTWIPFYMEMADKLLTYKDKRKPLLHLIYALGPKYVGYIKTNNDDQASDIDPFTVFGIFNRKISDDKRLYMCRYFKNHLKIKADIPSDFTGIPVLNPLKSVFFRKENICTDVQPLWNLFEAVIRDDKENTSSFFDKVCKQKGIKWNITMGLFWIRPYHYIALDGKNRAYLPHLGIEVFSEESLDYTHYIQLLNKIKNLISKDNPQEKSILDISYHAYENEEPIIDSDMKRQYWLVGCNYDSGSQRDRFIENKIWESRYDENKTIDLKQFSLAKTIKKGDIIILKSSSLKGQKKQKVPFLRVKGVGIVSSDIKVSHSNDYTQCVCSVDYISSEILDFEGSAYGAYQKTIHQANSKVQPIINYANKMLFPYSQYIDLLKEVHNLVFTGAPGTGKTYLAKSIAREMGCTEEEVQFVQFHPSYDYADFVEGLRPVENSNGQIGFERKDGVFKQFCKKAAKNLIDSEKSVEILKDERYWENKLQHFIDESIENNTEIRLKSGNDFTIEDASEQCITIHNSNNKKASRIAVNMNDILDLLINNAPLNQVKDIREHFHRSTQYQVDSYIFSLAKEIRKSQDGSQISLSVSKVERKNYIFIIDEINRGDASKIFGELFYAIDPEYRWNTQKAQEAIRVQTQLQNLVSESDTFAKGFYVPENVYIIATMNDIDRSVESMDFAMRRRFTWKEIQPEERSRMLDEVLESHANDAKDTMLRLNNIIAGTEGLGTAFQIGPAYFLKLKDYGYDYQKLWDMNISPLLQEYLRGFRKVDEIMAKMKQAYFNTSNDTDLGVKALSDEED